MKVKDVVTCINADVEKGLEAIDKEDIRERVKPRIVRHFVGVYFEKEVRERLAKRFRSEIPESSGWSLKKEVLSYGQKLVGLTGVSQIDQVHFDRIVDCAIIEHNKKAAELRHAEESVLKAARRKQREAEPKSEGPKEPLDQQITLGMAVGAAS